MLVLHIGRRKTCMNELSLTRKQTFLAPFQSSIMFLAECAFSLLPFLQPGSSSAYLSITSYSHQLIIINSSPVRHLLPCVTLRGCAQLSNSSKRDHHLHKHFL